MYLYLLQSTETESRLIATEHTSGLTAIATSPNRVSGRVVAIVIKSSLLHKFECVSHIQHKDNAYKKTCAHKNVHT
jgi:hypothetical protein